MASVTYTDIESNLERILTKLCYTLDGIDNSLQTYKTMINDIKQCSIFGWSSNDTDSLIESISIIIYDIITQNPLLYNDPSFHENIVEETTNIIINQLADLLISNDNQCNCIKQQFIKQQDTTKHIEEDSIKQNEQDTKQVVKQKNIKKEKQTICSCINNISDESFERKRYEIKKLVEKSMSVFYRYISPRRSYKTSFVINSKSKNRLEKITKKIDYLKSIPQSQQRTKEWYDARCNYLTASNIWKAFGSQSSQNQLIYEKCVKKNMETLLQQNSFVSTESTLHWGQKYEPVSLMWYENEYSAKISDFGCIPHKSISFLAASPDGINTCITSSRYGRMIEIKNIVNREINGNPKMEYWIQMQIQMEVCDLNECDFIETKFVEYNGEDYYKKSSANEAGANEAGASEEEKNTDEMTHETADVSEQEAVAKGVIMFFIQNEKPLYEYSKINITPDEFEIWEAEMMEKHVDLTWNRNIYWKLEKVSCVLVLRNKLWFKSAYPVLKTIWDTIVRERNTEEYLNRAPKKRIARSSSSTLECNDLFVNLLTDETIFENPDNSTKT